MGVTRQEVVIQGAITAAVVEAVVVEAAAVEVAAVEGWSLIVHQYMAPRTVT